ncbi:MAG: hypothetical protein AB8H12_13505 [Lewinella sp.]
MPSIERTITAISNLLLSPKVKAKAEKIILGIAITSYIIHLSLILLNTYGILNLNEEFLNNPIAAIYTPFSFILLYEVYLLVYYIPKSITIYIGKQYEIITLIVIRRIFKDIAYVELTSDWFQDKNDLQFTFDVLTSLLLFALIFLFYFNAKKKEKKSSLTTKLNVKKFILLKKFLAILLIPILLTLSMYALINWGDSIFKNYADGIIEFKKINNIFFDQFFTILITTDVLLLLASFYYSDEFHKIIRNSGFVISTILIKVSFLSEGILNNILIISAVLFGSIFLIIHNLYEKKLDL